MRVPSAICALLLCSFASLSWSQTQSATVRGEVQDSTGATVPGATLTLTNLDQNRPWTTQSNEVGAYIFQQIPPGPYSLTVEADGFIWWAVQSNADPNVVGWVAGDFIAPI